MVIYIYVHNKPKYWYTELIVSKNIDDEFYNYLELE